MCYDRKGRLYFTPNKAKVNTKLYPDSLKTASLFHHLVSFSNKTQLAQGFIKQVTGYSLEKMNGHETPQTLTILFNYHLRAMLGHYKTLHLTLKTIDLSRNNVCRNRHMKLYTCYRT